LILRAHAKVNLALAIGKSSVPGGLHPICSWMHAIELFDRIEICPLSQDQESMYSIGWAKKENKDEPVDWEMEQDLAVRAHKLFEAHVGHQLPVLIRISKSIPAGGGLGGGSSDAASVLMGINRLFDLQLNQTTLVKLAMKLGSDVPFFLDSGKQVPRPAIIEGVGEKITRLDSRCAGEPITLIFPGFECSTGRVYRAFDEQIGPGHTLARDTIYKLTRRSVVDTDGLFNDLQIPACGLGNGLGAIKSAIEDKIGKPAHVSGSGSTLFVIGQVDSGLVGQAAPACRILQTWLC